MRTLAILFFSLLTTSAVASESQFSYVYTTDLLPKGSKEIEQWLTWRNHQLGGNFNLLEGRTAVEYGVADNYQVALYAIYDWMQAYHNGPGGATTPAEPFVYDQPGPDEHYTKTRFVGVAAEQILRVLSPYTDPVGLALYLEPVIGNRFIELESKLILQKNFFDDTLTLAFNFTWAPEFRLTPPEEGSGDTKDSWTEETDMNFNFAASYRFAPNWWAGFEFLNEQERDSLVFENTINSGYYIGPNIHFGGKEYFVTATAVTQLPWASEHGATVPGAMAHGYVYDNDFEKYRVRVKAGFYF
jgi:hypothetical protein